MTKKTIPFLIFLISAISVFAQQEANPTSKYDPHALFSPLFYPSGATGTRAATGEPNTGYWQNKADYQITASLNDVTNEITGTVTITYKNNSPHALPFLWLLLEQNLFNKESR